MSSTYEIIPAEAAHCRLLLPRLRGEDCAEILGMGVAAKRGLWRSWKRSVIRYTAIIDGEVGAMWGLWPSEGMLSRVGMPWLLTSDSVERLPIAFLKEARRGVSEMLDVYPRLENYVLASYERAVRFLVSVGFEMGEPEPMLPHGVLYRRFWMDR